MKKTIYTKFVIAYAIFGLLSALTIALFTSDLTLDHLAKQKANDLYKEANLIANQYGHDYYSGQLTLPQIDKQFLAISTFLDVEIWLTNKIGVIKCDTSEEYLYNTHIPNFDPSASGANRYQIGTYNDMFEESVITVCAPIAGSYGINGYIIIHASISSIEATRDNLLNISYTTLAVIWILSLTFLVIFTLFVFLPIKKITKAANEYASENFKYKFSVPGHDEIGTLAGTLQYMAHELDKSKDYQKKFIANISHDFRSPLTSIKGYIEAILDGTIPPEMQERYLNIVINETERLSKLTNDILTISSYDRKGNYLEISNFDINSAIKNTLNTFEGNCTKRKISFELTFSSEAHIVKGDMGKIQQVLYNLIDNAIKFSPNNSMIKIGVTEKNGKVMVSIKDSGIGIPKDSISKIWDRFYKTDLSRGKDKKGTGLGLSITREIIEAHNENINVVSTEGVGTEFIFTLAKGKRKDDVSR
ncbi:MAG: HAMP domain-containing histidine kinase [Lachnospiraceae bacterium]|nr:HAMP domain-containing histidine kinase [Lachnospiraceae bacterium]